MLLSVLCVILSDDYLTRIMICPVDGQHIQHDFWQVDLSAVSPVSITTSVPSVELFLHYTAEQGHCSCKRSVTDIC